MFRFLRKLLGSLLDVDDLAVLVKAAFRAYAVLPARFLAVRTEGGLRYAQTVMRPAFPAA
jgi:hypothetical protein